MECNPSTIKKTPTSLDVIVSVSPGDVAGRYNTAEKIDKTRPVLQYAAVQRRLIYEASKRRAGRTISCTI